MHDLFSRLRRPGAPLRLAALLLLLLALPAAAARAQRGIALDGVRDGSGDGGLVVLPNAAPWNSMGDFEIAFRLRDVRTRRTDPNAPATQLVFSHAQMVLDVDGANDNLQLSFPADNFKGDIKVAAHTYFKIRHVLASREVTLEAWDDDGGNYSVAVFRRLSTNPINFSGNLGVGRFHIVNDSNVRATFDWLRWGGAAGPKGVRPRDCDFRYDLLRYEFEDDTLNSAGAGPNMTFGKPPTFAVTPGTARLVVCAGEDRTAKPGQTVSFDARNTYSKAGPVTYSWAQVQGDEPAPAVTIVGADTATPSFAAPELPANADNAEVVLRVTAADALGSASDQVSVGVVRVDALDRVLVGDEVKRFIIGPQVIAGSASVPSAERFERKYNMELARWLDAFPAVPPSRKKPGSVSVAAGGTLVTGVGTNFRGEIDMGAKADRRMSHSIAIRDPDYKRQAQVNWGGSGYTSAALCTVTRTSPGPPGSTEATCSAVVNAGVVTSVEITQKGSGYDSIPRVKVVEGGNDSAAVEVGIVTEDGPEKHTVIGNRHFSLAVASVDPDAQELTLAEPFPSSTPAAGVPWHTDAVDKASGKSANGFFEEASRYDLTLIAYRQFYRTGLRKWRDGARKVADSRWASDFIGHGTVVEGPMVLPPFVAEWGGFIMRAADGRERYWDYVYRMTLNYLTYGFGNLVDTTKTPGPVFGPDSDGRNAGWAMEWGAMVARALPDQYPLQPQGTLVEPTQSVTDGATRRANLLTQLDGYFTNAYERLQYPDGSWRWNVPNWPGGDLQAISQPYMVGIMLEGLAALHSLTPDCSKRARMEAVMKKALDHLDNTYLGDVPVIPGNGSVPEGIKWRAPGYFSRGGPASDPSKYAGRAMNGGGAVSNVATSLDGGDGSVGGTRWQQPFWLYPAGYYYSLTGNTTYLTRAEEYFDSVWGGSDIVPLYWYGTKDSVSTKSKDFGEAYSTVGLYLAYRLQATAVASGGGGGTDPSNLTATASASGTTFSVTLTWTPPAGDVTGYVVERKGPGGVTTTTSVPGGAATFTDSQVQAGKAYVYRVRAQLCGGASTAFSNKDLAATFAFDDDPLAAFSVVRAVHVTQLRDAVNEVRDAAGLPDATWTNAVSAGAIIRRADVTDLRARLGEALSALGIAEPAYEDPTLPAGTVIKRAHVQQLRDALK